MASVNAGNGNQCLCFAFGVFHSNLQSASVAFCPLVSFGCQKVAVDYCCGEGGGGGGGGGSSVNYELTTSMNFK